MVLGAKILIISISSIVVTTTAGLVIQRSVIRRQGIEMTRAAARAGELNCIAHELHDVVRG